MKKLISLILLGIIVISVSSCSLIPRLTFDSKGTTPQSIDKAKAKEVCKGKAIWNENGDIISCSKGYVNYTQNYIKKERKFTIMERVGNFIRTLSGMGFWALVLVAFLFPGLLGGIITFIFSASRRVARETIKAVKSFRRNVAPEVKEDLDNYLRKHQSKATKKYIAKERTNEE